MVAAIHGTALGGGLEIALGCHYRVAVPTAKLGVPEVKLGLLPGAGGTQRLPRVAGVPKALEMVTGGGMIGAKEAHDIGLVDRIWRGDLQRHALATARGGQETSVHCPNRPSGRTRLPVPTRPVFADFRKTNARKFRGFDAPEANIKAVEAAVAKPYAEGVLDERNLFMGLIGGAQARAQQYFFLPNARHPRSTASPTTPARATSSASG